MYLSTLFLALLAGASARASASKGSPIDNAKVSLADPLRHFDKTRQVSPMEVVDPNYKHRKSRKHKFGLHTEHHLQLAERHYQTGPHYRAELSLALRWPGVLIRDQPEIGEITCGKDAITLDFTTQAAFDQAAEWVPPYILMTEGWDGMVSLSYCAFHELV